MREQEPEPTKGTRGEEGPAVVGAPRETSGAGVVGGGTGPASCPSKSLQWLGLCWGCRKVAVWVSPSSCVQVIPQPGAREMIPPEGQA